VDRNRTSSESATVLDDLQPSLFKKFRSMVRNRTFSLLTFLLIVAFALTTEGGEVLKSVGEPNAAYRVPVGVAWLQDRLFVANSRTGTVSRIEPDAQRVTAEWKVAESLSGIAAWRDDLLLLDDHCHRLIRVRIGPDSGELQRVDEIELPKYPVHIAVSEDQSTVAVSSLWSRRLTLLTGDDHGLQRKQIVDLKFAPRLLKFLPGGLLVVADSFGSELAIVNRETGIVLNEHKVYGHNIRGLGLNAADNKLLVACQTLDPATFTTYERVFWGVLMQNGLHSLPLDRLLTPSAEADDDAQEQSTYSRSSYTSPQQYPLGTPSIGSGDPGAMVVTHNDTTLILISGVNQVAFRTARHLPFERLKTGRRPEAICLDDAQQRAFIANRFDDSITVISLAGESPVVESTISLGKLRPLSGAEQGEQSFYSASVSLDGWFSCHSCHTDGHTNGQRADTFGDEDRGAPKKVVSLLGLVSTGPWAWNGSKKQLEEQIRTSLIITMQTQISTDELPIAPLAAYLKTLQPAPSLREARGETLTADLLVSANEEFERAGCRSCHSGSAFTSDDVFDVGIHDEMGETMFNPPSLRGVSQRAPYFHDGRAASLPDVLKTSHHNPENGLTDEQIQRLTQLLESL